MSRVLIVLEHSGAAFQDQVRGPIFAPLFKQAGIHVRYLGRHPPPPLSWTTSRSRARRLLSETLEYRAAWAAWDLAGTRLNDRRILAAAGEADVVLLVKSASAELAQALRARTSARIVYDLGDALWLPYHAGSYGHLEAILRTADAVTCDNPYGLDYARGFCAETYLWPPPSQVERFDTMREQVAKSSLGGEVRVGWIGSPSTAFNLFHVWEALEEALGEHPGAHLRLVGTGTHPDLVPHFERVRVTRLPSYDGATMLREVLAMDVGVFPMFDVYDSRTRGILKALIYMSGEAAVLASPRGLIPDLIEHGRNGMLVDSATEWVEALRRLVADAALRHRLAAEGLSTVRERFRLEDSFRALRAALAV